MSVKLRCAKFQLQGEHYQTEGSMKKGVGKMCVFKEKLAMSQKR